MCRKYSTRAIAIWTIIAAGLLLTGGCVRSYKIAECDPPILSQIYKPREEPAKITLDSEETLKSKGFSKLGNVSAFYPTNTKDEKKAVGQLKEMLLEKVAQCGGDVVRIESENVFGKIVEYHDGWCLDLELHRRAGPECHEWEQVPFPAEGLKTTGSIWSID